jgi:putative FmdB family regulatory protein
MPVYEFLCEGCGPFERRRSFEEAGEPMLCPGCGAAAKRVYSVPGVVKTPANISRALNRAEKSAHEPEVVRQEHSPGAHEHRHRGSGRPWQLGH